MYMYESYMYVMYYRYHVRVCVYVYTHVCTTYIHTCCVHTRLLVHVIHVHKLCVVQVCIQWYIYYVMCVYILCIYFKNIIMMLYCRSDKTEIPGYSTVQTNVQKLDEDTREMSEKSVLLCLFQLFLDWSKAPSHRLSSPPEECNLSLISTYAPSQCSG